MNNKSSKKLIVTAVFDNHSKAITAFFNEFPGLIVQANSLDDVKVKLDSLLKSYIKRLQSIGNNFEIITTKFT
jgi:hypothetical protein